jgi:hypothetical protein
MHRFLESGVPELTSYAARRVLTASTRGGRMQGQLEAWTYLDGDGSFRFEVVCTEGSELIHKRVLLGALEAEERSRQKGETKEAEISHDNYQFVPALPTAEGVSEIRLQPRRKSRMLIDGSTFVEEASADLVRIQGRLSKTPSWWTRRVDIIRRYARIGGVRVPVEMTSTADVRLAGSSSFSMTYHYAMINGEPIPDRTSSDCNPITDSFSWDW